MKNIIIPYQYNYKCKVMFSFNVSGGVNWKKKEVKFAIKLFIVTKINKY